MVDQAVHVAQGMCVRRARVRAFSLSRILVGCCSLAECVHDGRDVFTVCRPCARRSGECQALTAPPPIFFSCLQEWRRRYFILKGSKLFFCKNAQSGPHGMMDLATCTTVKSADLKSGKRHSLEISTTDTCYLLYADTETEKDDWIGRVGKAIVRCSRTYYRGSSSGGGDGNSNNNNNGGGSGAGHHHDEDEDDDIYENDDPDNPYFND